MRKMLWTCCLTGSVVAACLCWSTWYAYENPNSLLGRCMAVGLQFSVKCNPLLNGLTTASVEPTQCTDRCENVADCCCRRA